MNATRDPGSDRSGIGAGALPLGRWAGVPVAANWSTLVTLALFTWLLAGDVLPSAVPGRSQAAYWAVGAMTTLVFLATLLAHELAHAVTARRHGLRVRRITLWLLGGLTELDGEAHSAGAEARIAASGALVSLALGVIGQLAYWLTGVGGLGGAAVLWLAGMCLLLGVFNLLPGAPLDGGRLLRAWLWHRYRDPVRASDSAAGAGRVLGGVLMALGVAEFLLGGLAGLWLALLGWFILTASQAERYAAGLHRLDGLTAAQLMRPAEFPAPEWWTVEQVLDEMWRRRAPEAVAVVDFTGQVAGVLTLRALQRVGAAQRGTARVRDVCTPAHTVPLDAPASDCLPLVRQYGAAVVVDAGRRPVGLVSAAELSRALVLATVRDPRSRAGRSAPPSRPALRTRQGEHDDRIRS